MVAAVDDLIAAQSRIGRGDGLPRSPTRKKHGNATSRKVPAITPKSSGRSSGPIRKPNPTAMYEPK